MKKIFLFLFSAITLLLGIIPLKSVPASAFYDPSSIKFLDTSQRFSVLVTQNDEIFTWGNRFMGNLGDNNTVDNNVLGFSRITNSGDLATKDPEDSIVQALAGNNVVAFLTDSGQIYASGFNNGGSVGTGNTDNVYVPTLINGGALATIEDDDKVIRITHSRSGARSVHALTAKGRIFGWGTNFQYGGVGNGTGDTVASPVEITSLGEFSLLEENEYVIDLVNNSSQSVALTNTGRLFAWGFNFSNLMLPLANPSSASSLFPKLLDMNAGAFANLALENDKLVKLHQGFWGSGIMSEQGKMYYFGYISSNLYSPPVLLKDFQNFPNLNDSESITSLIPSNGGFLVQTNQHRIFSYGANSGSNSGGVGSLGNGNSSFIATPFDITESGAFAELEEDDEIIFIVSFDASYAISRKGRIFAWGNNNFGQYFGDASLTGVNTPIDVTDLYKTSIVDAIFTPSSLVEAKIDLLPSVTDLTLEDLENVVSVREAFDALTTEQQALVANISDLIALENQILLLQQQAIDQAAAQVVIDQIAALPSLINLTLEDTEAVEAARLAFDALTPDQKVLVTNLATLEALEAQLFVLNDEAEAQVIIDQIAALPTVDDLTLEYTEAVEAARLAYDALTPAQQSLVTNYQTLLDLEAQLLVLSSGFELTETMWILIAALAGAITALLFWIFFKDRTKGEQLVVQPTSVKVAKPVSKPVEVKVEPKKVAKPVQAQVVQPTITTIQLDEVVLPNFETRPVLKPLSKVNPGHYLEVTKEKESTNRVVEVKDALPEALDDSNAFVSITKEEVSLVKLSLTSTANFVKKTPGSFVDPGYYVEVNLKDEIVDNYILAKKRLPPSSAKGHRWIRIEKRAIRSKK